MKSFENISKILEQGHNNYKVEYKKNPPLLSGAGKAREAEYLRLKDDYEQKTIDDDRTVAFIALCQFIFKQSDNSRLKTHLINSLFEIFKLQLPEDKSAARVVEPLPTFIPKAYSSVCVPIPIPSQKQLQAMYESNKKNEQKAVKKKMVGNTVISFISEHASVKTEQVLVNNIGMPGVLAKIVKDYLFFQEKNTVIAPSDQQEKSAPSKKI